LKKTKEFGEEARLLEVEYEKLDKKVIEVNGN